MRGLIKPSLTVGSSYSGGRRGPVSKDREWYFPNRRAEFCLQRGGGQIKSQSGLATMLQSSRHFMNLQRKKALLHLKASILLGHYWIIKDKSPNCCSSFLWECQSLDFPDSVGYSMGLLEPPGVRRPSLPIRTAAHSSCGWLLCFICRLKFAT